MVGDFLVKKNIILSSLFVFLLTPWVFAKPSKKITPAIVTEESKNTNTPVTVSISPEGNIETTQQIQVRFNKNMVTLGDQKTETPAPVDSNCFGEGSGYWTDAQSWVYDFAKPPAVNKTCVISTKVDLKTLQGQIVPAKKVEFKTLTAQVLQYYPNFMIVPQQSFVLITNGEVNPEWIKKNVYFSVQGLGDQIVPEIIQGAEREKIIKNAFLSEGLERAESNTEKSTESIYVLRSPQVFPREKNVILRWIKDFNFSVEKSFKAEFHCDRESAASDCIPLLDFTLKFTDSISGELAKEIYLLTPDKKKIFSEQKNVSDLSNHYSVTFKGPFEAKTEYTLVLNKIKNLDGDKLTNQEMFPLKFKTSELPSLLKIERPYTVIEDIEPIFPVTVRNIENTLPLKMSQFNLNMSGAKGTLKSNEAVKIIDLYQDLRYESEGALLNFTEKKPFELKVNKTLPNEKTEVVGIPLKTKGFHVIELKSKILGEMFSSHNRKKKDFYIHGAALVTNLNITLKSSPLEVLAWVTSLDKGKPLEKVKVQLMSPTGMVIKETLTDAKGIAFFNLSEEENMKLHESRPSKYDRGFFAFAQFEDDFAFVNSDEDSGLSLYRYNINLPYKDPENIYHALLEKNLLRPKEILNAKLIYRHVEEKGLSIPKIDLPKEIQITSRLHKKAFKTPVQWDLKTGTGLISWKVPDQATLGNYSISFPSGFNLNEEGAQVDEESSEGEEGADNSIQFGSFQVQEFKTPSISASLQALGIPWYNVNLHEIEFSAHYFSGGPAAGMPIEIMYTTAQDPISITDINYENYQWQKGEVIEGLNKMDRKTSQNKQPQTNQIQMKVDRFGNAKFRLEDLHYEDVPQRAIVEVTYKDSNGDIQNLSRAYPFYGSPWLLGIKAQSWFVMGDSFDFEAAILDLKQKPVKDQEVTFTLFQQENYSTRKKLLGGFYSYESFEEVNKIKDICKIKTNFLGKAKCHYSDKKLRGTYVVMATVKDPSGNKIATNVDSYVYGDDYWYGSENSDRMDLIPLKKSFEPGEIAEFQVKGPITEGQMLVTVERGSILYQEVMEFKASEPVIKLNIQEDWSPNVVVSAVLLRGRVPGKISGLLDLGKPALKMGLSSIQVGTKKFELNVKVKTQKEVFEPRENIETEIFVTDSNGKPINGEVSIAAVDEALLALSPNGSWDLLKALYPLRAHRFDTSYMIAHVLGKRTLGLKAVPSGGDGGRSTSRELFETSLYWNPKVNVREGFAKVSFKANDSLTAFKIVAMAISGAEKFGTGESNIRITKEIQAFSSLAMSVRKGDSYLARFNVRNSGKSKVALKAKLKFNRRLLEVQDLTLADGQTQEINWPVISNEEGVNLFELQITDANGKIFDSLAVKQPSSEVWPMRAVGSHLQQGISLSLPVKKSELSTQALAQATAMPSLASEIPGLKKYWDLYPFDCFEQKLSRAVSLNSKSLFDELMKNADAYLDEEGFIKFYPTSIYGSVFLTNYVLQITAHQGWDLNPEFQSAALKALRKFFDGNTHGHEFYLIDQSDFIRIETLDTLTLYKQSEPQLYSTIKYKMELLPTNYLVHEISILSRDLKIPNQEKLLAQALQILKSRTVLSSGRLVIKDSIVIDLTNLYTDQDQLFAKALIQILKNPLFRDDAGRLILSFMEQMVNGSWNTTMDNAWGALALRKYQEEFEKVPVKGQINWGLTGLKNAASIENKSVSASWPLSATDQFEAHFTGSGKPWWNLLVLANPMVNKDINHGMVIEKKLKPISVKDEDVFSVGDVWQITLKIKSPSKFAWLAIRDPLPPGATVMSQINVEQSEKKDLEFRAYKTWFDERYEISYEIRLNQSGTFHLPTTRAEAMYNPDLFGEKVNGDMVINP
jgi:uncharacterized protein YfaS (alpha-2-macroglobulin family)